MGLDESEIKNQDEEQDEDQEDRTSDTSDKDKDTSRKDSTKKSPEEQKRLSDEKAAEGRQKAKELADAKEKAEKDLEEALANNKAKDDKIDTLTKRLDDLEMAGFKDDPEALEAWKNKKTTEAREADLERRERDLKKREIQLKEDIEALTKRNVTTIINSVAKEYGIKSSDLRDDMDGFSTADLERFQARAERYAKLLKGASSEDSDKDENEDEGYSPDSGRSSGGSGKPSNKQMDKESMADYAKRRQKEIMEKTK